MNIAHKNQDSKTTATDSRQWGCNFLGIMSYSPESRKKADR